MECAWDRFPEVDRDAASVVTGAASVVTGANYESNFINGHFEASRSKFDKKSQRCDSHASAFARIMYAYTRQQTCASQLIGISLSIPIKLSSICVYLRVRACGPDTRQLLVPRTSLRRSFCRLFARRCSVRLLGRQEESG